MRALLLASLLGSLVLAGCVEPGEGPAPVPPATGDLWVVASSGCGACSGSPETPEFHADALHRGGTLVRYEYSRGYPDGQHVQFAEGVDAAGRRLALHLFAHHEAYAEEDPRWDTYEPVRVHAVRWWPVEVDPAEVQALIDGTAPPREVPCDSADAGGTSLTVMEAGGAARHAHLGCERFDDGWMALAEHLGGLHRTTDPEAP